MGAGLPGWTADLERRFKELLYRFLEEVHSTKAALYLLAEDGRYLLATQYGFGRRDLLAAEFPARAPLVQLARQLRNRPRGYNGPEATGELSDYLEGAGNARLLLAPLYAGSRLLGFVDARDKGRKKPFTGGDEQAAAAIARALVELIREEGLYPELEDSAPHGAPVRLEVQPPPPSGRESVALDRAAMEELLAVSERLAGLPELGGVLLTLFENGDAHTVVRAPAGFSEDELEAARRHHAGLVSSGGGGLTRRRWTFDVRPVPGESSGPREIAASAVLLRDEGWCLVASILGGLGSDGPARALEVLAGHVRALQRATRVSRRWRRLARLLLEPGERRYPELRQHSEAVSRLAWRLAAALGEDDETVEAAAVAGLLHDVGMRELDYERLYRHPTPGPTERRLYNRHPLIGEQILGEAGLPVVAQAVRHHHERWDGGGYPDRLQGPAIPLLSRIVHAAEVYDVLTSEGSYRRPVDRREALRIMRSAAGHQFDPEVIRVLEGVV